MPLLLHRILPSCSGRGLSERFSTCRAADDEANDSCRARSETGLSIGTGEKIAQRHGKPPGLARTLGKMG